MTVEEGDDFLRELEEERKLFAPQPFVYSDAEWKEIAPRLPKNADADAARRKLEQCCGRYLSDSAWWEGIGARKNKSERAEAHKQFVDTARAFIASFTEQIDNLHEYMTHEFNAPPKNIRRRLINEIGALADWHATKAREIQDGPQTYDFAKHWLINMLWREWQQLGGDGKRKPWQFIATAASPVLGPVSKAAIYDVIRHKQPKDKMAPKKRSIAKKPLKKRASKSGGRWEKLVKK